MTKKDYQLIAGVFYKAKLSLYSGNNEDFDNGEASEWRNLVSAMTGHLSLKDPRFNKQKFLTACGVETTAND